MLIMRNIHLCLLILCLVVSVVYTTPSNAANTEQNIQELSPEQEDAESEKARAEMVKAAAPVQAELKALYEELLAMRGSKDFVEMGFSAKNKLASNWKARVEAFRQRIAPMDVLPVQVRAAPAYLLTIGFDREWRKGRTNADSKWNMQMITDGINWKLEE